MNKWWFRLLAVTSVMVWKNHDRIENIKENGFGGFVVRMRYRGGKMGEIRDTNCILTLLTQLIYYIYINTIPIIFPYANSMSKTMTECHYPFCSEYVNKRTYVHMFI
jgi:hypothetical protein